jgi:hypothetical protein
MRPLASVLPELDSGPTFSSSRISEKVEIVSAGSDQEDNEILYRLYVYRLIDPPSFARLGV